MKLNRRHRQAILGAVVLVAGAAGAVAYAEKIDADEPANDAQPVSQAAISMVQAVQTAELSAAGRARRAEYEDSKQGWVYDVEVVSGSKVFDVRVSASNGSVLSKQEDTPDRDGRNEHEGKDDKD